MASVLKDIVRAIGQSNAPQSFASGFAETKPFDVADNTNLALRLAYIRRMKEEEQRKKDEEERKKLREKEMRDTVSRLDKEVRAGRVSETIKIGPTGVTRTYKPVVPGEMSWREKELEKKNIALAEKDVNDYIQMLLKNPEIAEGNIPEASRPLVEDVKARGLRAAEYLERDIQKYDLIVPGTKAKFGKTMTFLGNIAHTLFPAQTDIMEPLTEQKPGLVEREFPRIMSPRRTPASSGAGAGARERTVEIPPEYRFKNVEEVKKAKAKGIIPDEPTIVLIAGKRAVVE